MADDESTTTPRTRTRTRRTADSEPAAPAAKAPAKKAPAKKAAAAKAPAKKAAAAKAPAKKAAAAKAPAKTPAQKAAAKAVTPPTVMFLPPVADAAPVRARRAPAKASPAAAAPADGEAAAAPAKRTRAPRISPDDGTATPAAPRTRQRRPAAVAGESSPESADRPDGEPRGDDGEGGPGRSRRRRGRRGRGRGKGRGEGGEGFTDGDDGDGGDTSAPAAATDGAPPATGGPRKRVRRRPGEPIDVPDDGRTVVRVREPSAAGGRGGRGGRGDGGGGRGTGEQADGVEGVRGSTRLEAKRQRRRQGRDEGRRRPPVVTEAEFLARREAVERVMLVHQDPDRTQIAVLEDGILVEHYVTRADATSYAGNVYLGKVQNVLASMEAAFVDIGKGRNAVLYAGEVNYDASALEGRPPRIEQALKSGQQIVVQVTKDPVGQKGARLTSQVSLPGRYMVYVPEQSMTGISRKLPDTERARLKALLKVLKPEGAGIIIRTAAEGASEEELTADLDRLKKQWELIEKAAKKEAAPALLHGEPDLVTRVIRDTFNSDFTSLVVEGEGDFTKVKGYLESFAPDLMERLSQYDGARPLFDTYRVTEQILKALERKVSLPSGGSLVIDRTEAMTVVDVNTGRFTGKGGNLEETVTRNNLEAAEEVVRQLRLRDIGGIVVIDFIDMLLEGNRELVLRRLKECLGRDRTKHQVSEITSLGLLQLTRKRVGQGLHEAFLEPCPECNGRGTVRTDHEHDHMPGSVKPMTPSPLLVAKAIAKPAVSPNGDVPEDSAGAADDDPVAAEPVEDDIAQEPVVVDEPVVVPEPVEEKAKKPVRINAAGFLEVD